MDRDQTQQILARYLKIRAASEAICAPLSAEDCMVQAAEWVSPAKWHLAHTSWFFERFLLRGLEVVDAPYHPRFDYIFNSYYEGAGSFHPRPRRGLLARPSLAEVKEYRRYVDEQIQKLEGPTMIAALSLLELGLHHEQQHQELLLTDIKYNAFAQALPIAPYPAAAPIERESEPLTWTNMPRGLHRIGHQEEGFAFDNESPAHLVYIGDAALASRPVTNGEFMAFLDEGAYQRPELWLSDGWHELKTERLEHPLYWQKGSDGSWREFTLHGWEELDPLASACHLSYYEADAFARWQGARLPTEEEWEVWARQQKTRPARFDRSDVQARRADSLASFSAVWEWTMSSYAPYPGYKPWSGTIGEYNGKFMANQYVLRGGSCASPSEHVRVSYRNFFPPNARWQFSGLRLAKDLL